MPNLISDIDGILKIYDDGTVDIISGGQLSINGTTVFDAASDATLNDVSVNTLNFGDASPTLSDNGNYLRIQTTSGYMDIGSNNTSYAHFYTDRPTYFFDKFLTLGGNKATSYGADLELSRINSATARLRITAGTTHSDQDLSVTGDVTISGDLTVSGTTTTLNTSTITAEDAVILLNSGQVTPSNDIGLIFQRYSSPTASNYNTAIIWDEGSDRFILGTTAEAAADADITMSVEMATINSAGVGVGTANPSARLHTYGTGWASNVVGSNLLRVEASGNTGAAIAMKNANGEYWNLYNGGSSSWIGQGNLGFVYSDGSNDPGGPKMTLTKAGNLGIGVTNPSQKLEVYGTTYTTALNSPALGVWTGQSSTSGAGTANGFEPDYGPDSPAALSTGYNYIFRLTTVGTGTDTGATYIVWYNEASLIWTSRAVSVSGVTSNHPLLSVATNGVVTIYTNHPSAYSIRWTAERRLVSEPDATPHSLGEFYNWQRSYGDLFYTDGEVGIGTNPSTNFHVYGSSDPTIRIQGDNSMALHQDAAWNSNIYFGAYHDGTNVVYGASGRGAFRMVNLHDGDTSPQYIALYGANAGTAGATVSWNTVGFVQDEDGNVGIGNTNPQHKIHFGAVDGYYTSIGSGNRPPGGAQPWLGLFNNSDIASATFGWGFYDSNTDGSLQIWNKNNSTTAYNTFTIKRGGNVGIGTTNPDRPLHILSSSNNAPLKIDTSDGTQACIAYALNGNDIWYAGVDLNANGGEDFFIYDATVGAGNRLLIDTNGNVGIGTNSPDEKLHVVGNLLVTGKIVGNNEYLLPNTGGIPQWCKVGTWSGAGQGGHTIRVSVTAHSGYNASNSQDWTLEIFMKTSNSSSVDANGAAYNSWYYKIGPSGAQPQVKWVANAAGTSATSYDLYLFIPNFSLNSIYKIQKSTGTWTEVGSTGQADPGAGSSTVVVAEGSFNIQDTNVGIGITNPGYKLDVQAGSAVAARFETTADYQITLQSDDAWTGIWFDDSGGVADPIWHNGTYGTFAMGGGGSVVSGKKLHVHGGMSVGSNAAGTTTPTNGLYVEGNVSINGEYLKDGVNIISLQDAAPTGVLGNLWYETDTGVMYIYYDNFWVDIAPQPGSSSNLQLNSLGVGTAASGTTGEIRATNDVTAYYSDAKLKDFEGTIPNAVDKVKQLNGYYFRENEIAKGLGYTNDNRQVGVSAQEVQEVLPEIVTAAPISDEYLTVKYEKLAPLLIEAIKEQQSTIEKQQEQIDQLMELVNKLSGGK